MPARTLCGGARKSHPSDREAKKLRGFRLTKAAELAKAVLRLPGEALAAHPHEQPARAPPARDQATHACGRGIPRRPIGLEPRRGQTAPHRWHGVVDQTIPEHRTAEGPADERSYHRL